MSTVISSLNKYIENYQTSYIPELNASGKIIDEADLIIKVKTNLFKSGFMNRDICRVIAQLDDDLLYLKRLEDGHRGVVHKSKVSYPKWVNYPF